MSSFSSSCHKKTTLLLVLAFLFCSHLSVTFGGDLRQDFEITWGDWRTQMLNNGQLLTLSLDKASGSGFKTKNEFLFGKFDIQIKLVPGNSAGTITSFYLKSQVGSTWDEIDFEFLGNLSGDPYTLNTNIITQGKSAREQQFRLWFDPTSDFHTYSILWNPQTIIFYVDGNTPIREFKNYESSIGVPFPKNQAMMIFGSLWDGEDWATRGGAVKTNWTAAPFTASFRDYNANACVWSSGASSSGGGNSSSSGQGWIKQELSPIDLKKLKRVQRDFMIYNYCTDLKRFPQGLPPECSVTNKRMS